MGGKENKLFMIGNAHLDPVWLWQWQEGFAEVKATFRSALDRMNEYPDFIFTSSSAAYYEWVENNDKVMFEEIKARVEEGRWVIVGGWWIQPDCNAPCGESFARQGLYAQRYFYEKFGIIAHTGYNVDSFGHNGMLPQILRKCGMENYVFMRPGRHEKAIPSNTFKWQASDGSIVNAFRIPFEYCTWPDELKAHIKRCASEIKDKNQAIMCFYGVGNHGGGPTKKNIESISTLNDDPEMPTLILASPDMFFDSINKSNINLPVVQGELFHHSSGCYSVHSEVKMLNRKVENRLLMAEKFSTIANVTVEQKYPISEYTRAWKDVLFNQFHDIMAGTSIQPAYDDAREAYGAALHSAATGMNYAVQAMSWNIDIPIEEAMKPIVVFNPHSFKLKSEIQMESTILKEGTVLLDNMDNEVPFQLIQSATAVNGRCRLCFIADLPAFGYRTYRLVKSEHVNDFEPLNCTDTAMENQWFKVEFDSETGYISSFTKKNDGSVVFAPSAAKPVVIEDNSDTWSHGVLHFNNIIGEFTAKRVLRVEHGPVKSVIRVVSEYNKSQLIQDFAIYKEMDFIEVKTTLDWHEKNKMLKIQFPMNLNYCRGSYEIPYGVSQRQPNGEEYPMQSWVDFEGTAPGMETPCVGVSILNDGKFSCSAENKVVSITVTRSPVYAHHEPFIPDENLEYTYIDQGVQQFTYALYPHDGCWEEAETVKRALLINQRPTALFETFHKGKLPQTLSFIDVSAENIIVSAMKQAEDGNGDIVIRAYETSGKNTHTLIKFPTLGRELSIDFSPCEIKTIRVPLRKEEEIAEISMLEQ